MISVPRDVVSLDQRKESSLADEQDAHQIRARKTARRVSGLTNDIDQRAQVLHKVLNLRDGSEMMITLVEVSVRPPNKGGAPAGTKYST